MPSETSPSSTSGTNDPRFAPFDRKSLLAEARCVVVKVGTRVLTSSDGKLDRDRIRLLSAGLSQIADSGRQVVMVSSGAVGAGLGKLRINDRPDGLAQLQAIAAIGQTDLIQAYEESLTHHNRHAAQILLTASDLRRRSGYLHVRNALTQIHGFGAIAIVNENDSVAVSELMTTFGDNDGLAAQVAGLLSEVMLIILSDVDGLLDGPPDDPRSRKLDVVPTIDDSIRAMAQVHRLSSSKGGMASKLDAAALANSHGNPVIIAPGRNDTVLQRIFEGENVGTLFLPNANGSIRGRRRWIGKSARVAGKVIVDEGAATAILTKRSSLLAIGITSVEGSFPNGSVIEIADSEGTEIARGLSNYPSIDISKIKGKSSEKISEILGHQRYETVVHRDNLTVTGTSRC